MSYNIINQSPYLKSAREFPQEISELCREINKAYVEIASSVNNRTISLFPVNKSAITGESWYLSGIIRQQSIRRVYTFTTTADIDIGFKLTSIDGFTRNFGEYTDGTSWYGLIHSSNVAIAGQLGFYVTVNGASTTSDIIRFTTGAGSPALSSGKIVLEWLSVA